MENGLNPAEGRGNLEFPKKVIRHYGKITRWDRNLLNQHPRGVLWFTGLSPPGKSTIAYGIEQKLFNRGIRSYALMEAMSDMG